jgi:hypothetical protein|nr:MAG TPA: hypothetical protein [Caudoviricetes sp.]
MNVLNLRILMMNLVRNDTMQGLNEQKELEVAVIEIQIRLMRVVRSIMNKKKCMKTAIVK